MRGSIRPLVRAIGALLLLALLVVGVPALLLATVGNPFPSQVPTFDEIRVTLTQNGQGLADFLVSAIALLVWFIWLQLVVALVVEIVATIRRRETQRLPTAPGIQHLAARLVATITLATSLAAGPLVAPALGALDLDGFEAPVSTVVLEEGEDGTGAAVLSTQVDRLDGPQHITSTRDVASNEIVASQVVIVPDETELWDLAEVAYGDGVQWRTIADANVGSLDGAGRAITADTEVVAAGTSLTLPGAIDHAAVARVGQLSGGDGWISDGGVGAWSSLDVERDDPRSEQSSVQPPTPSTEPIVWTADSAHVVADGESMWSIAEDRVERQVGDDATDADVAAYWVDVVEANQNVPSGDVDLIHPGDELDLPPVPGAPVVEPATASVEDAPAEVPHGSVPDLTHVTDGPVDPAATSPAVRVVADAGDANGAVVGDPVAEPPAPGDGAIQATPSAAASGSDADDSGASFVAPVSFAAFGSALMAAGVVGALRRRRALQRRLRPPGAMPQVPSTEAAAFEAALAHAGDQVIESAHGTGWRLVPASAVDVIRSTGPIEVHSARSGELLAVPLHDDPDPAPAGHAPPGPAVDLRDPPSTAALIDLFAIDPDLAEGAAAVADERAAAVPAAVLIGTDPMAGHAVYLDLESSSRVDLRGSVTDIRRLARSLVLDLSVSDRADDLCVIAVGVGEEMADLERLRSVGDLPAALVAAVHCGHGAGDSSTPVVVVSVQDAQVDEATIGALLELGASVVAPGQDTASTRITIANGQARVWPNGSTVQLAAFDDGDHGHVVELIETTAVDATAPVGSSPIEEHVGVVASAGCSVEPGPVEVKVLGPVEIQGAGSFSSVKAVDVVTYLAFHRHGVDADQIKTWVWPPFEPPTDKAFANVLSRARTALGTDDDGKPYLSRAGADRTYRLAEAVTTDFDRFRALVDEADRADDPNVELRALIEALDLIRGIPFTGGAASSFAWADNHVRAHVEYVVDEAVHRCADLALRLDELGAARQAAYRGLEVVPGCEQCFRRRFLVASADNNRAELRRAMSDLERTAAAELGEPEAVDTISSDLLALYHELDQSLVAGSA